MNKNGRLILILFVSFLLVATIIATIINKNAEVVIDEAPNQNENQVQEEVETEDTEEVESEPNLDNNENTDENEELIHNEESEQSEETVEKVDPREYIEGQVAPIEPTYINGVLYVSKHYPVPRNYFKGENPEALEAYKTMKADAKKIGFDFIAFSTHRTYEYQQSLYERYLERDGKEETDRSSARPGHSEHETGLAFDIGEQGKEHEWLTEEFGEGPAGRWLAENAHKYGFILRYPKGKEHITGFMYESWHFRYVGVDIATEIKQQEITLDEYLGIN